MLKYYGDKMNYRNLFKSKLSKRFFLVFLGYSLTMITLTVLIGTAVIFVKGPARPHHRPGPPPHHHTMEEEHRPPPHHLREHRPGLPPGNVHGFFIDLSATLSILVIFMIIFSFFIASYLSRSFLLPISKLVNASKKLAEHNFDIRIPENRDDEIGDLARDFNEMAAQLQKYEQMRKQWIADIAHELRTPISILQAEIEAVQDCVRPLDMKSINRLHSETMYLAKTVNNLHTLSLAESRHLTVNIEKITIPEIISESCSRFMEKIKSSKIKLETLFESDDLFVKGDSYLLRTIFNNLIENSIRYTDSPGELLISARRDGKNVIITFDDTKPGVPEELIDRIFDRLFRVDSSRSRIHGGSGLGLSTCQVYAQLLKGKISASNSEKGGLKITLELPGFIEEKEL